jgi:AbrB family looped-hinge helix DNA binding protein
MSLVSVKNKFQVVIPQKVRERIGIQVGDLLEAKVERRKDYVYAEVGDRSRYRREFGGLQGWEILWTVRDCGGGGGLDEGGIKKTR